MADPNLEALALDRHPLPEWAAFAEFRAGTGYRRGTEQRFDVAAFNCYPSKRGYRVVYEVKRSRGDFLRELKDPSKRAQAEDFFSETWFVTLPGVCTAEEVPDGWGLLVPTKKGDKLRQLKRARPRQPKDIPYTMITSLLRRSCERLSGRPTFEFEGRVVTAEDLDAVVKDRLQAETEALRGQWHEIERQRLKLSDERRVLTKPFEHLERAARGWLGRRGQAYDSLTPEAIDGLIAEAAAKHAAGVRKTVERARLELEQIERALAGEGARG